MKFNKYLLVVVDYDSETLEVHSLDDIGEVHRHFTEEVADDVIKYKKYKGAFEEAILLEVDVDSYFKNKDVINTGNILQNRVSKKLMAVTKIRSEYKIEVEDMIYKSTGWHTVSGSRRLINKDNIEKDFELVGENFKLFTKE